MKVAALTFVSMLAFCSLGADGTGCMAMPPPQQPQPQPVVAPPPQPHGRATQPPRPAPNPAPTLHIPTTVALGCRCAPGKRIVVQCSVTNRNNQPMTVTLRATAETGSIGVNASGTSQPVVLPVFATANYEVTTSFGALMDCSSCKNSACRVQ